MTSLLPDPHLLNTLAILDLLEAALLAATQSVCASHPTLVQQLELFDPTLEQDAARFLCSSAETVLAALRHYRLAIIDAHII